MERLPWRIVDYFASEPVRVSALLRLPLIALMGFLVWLWEVDSWLPEVYTVILGAYALAAALWAVAVFTGSMPWWGGWASTAVDVLAVVALCVVSGGATAALLPVFFLLPLSVAFGDRPILTGFLGVFTAICYLAAWLIYAVRDNHVDMPDVVYLQFAFLLWLAVATTALCLVLSRRANRVRALQEVRQRLVSEAMQADDRHNRELAEHLHDGPLQTLLAARLELDEARERNPDPALDRVYSALQDTAKGLRSTVTELHPQVLAQLGLTPAVRELLRQYETRFDVVADLEDVGKPASQTLMYRATRELLVNINKHARATTVTVRLFRRDDRIVMTVADDGTGFDPANIDSAVAEGHIGLGSLLVRFDAMGGAIDIDSQLGGGTLVTVTSPPEDALTA
ncbi:MULTISPECIES: sensor histidine kinase [unclassified Mycobacterium]|uniref:sensor histidine kinase n=1 Tax=unclassified Mycobacterium TaxID=2642494 RepID=UPI0029C7B354|nr:MULTISPECIES: ATP-binding protein [unclassified Mycobacterium]